MSSKLKKSFRIYYLGIIVTILLCIFSIIYICIKDEKFNLDSNYERILKNNYIIDINYPVFTNSKVNQRIEKIIKDEKKTFLDTIDKDANYENELNISYSYTTKGDLYSIHLRSYSYTGEDNKYYRNDNIFYLDSLSNKEINLDDLVIDDTFYELVKEECYNYLLSQNKFEIYESTVIEESLKKNNNLIIFSEDMIYVIFPPHIVSPYDSEISVPVSYESLYTYLNSSYLDDKVKDDNKDSINTDNDNNKNEEKEEIVVKEFKRIRDFSEFEGKKVVALTFDDGPSYTKTETLLTEFEKRNVRATFFVLGELANKQPTLVKKMYDMGHTIGSHTYDHKNLKNLDDEELHYEIDYTNELLKSIIGTDIKFIRPPYGSYNKQLLEKVNMSFILWNKDSLDWKLRDATKLADYLVKNVEDGDIVLMHDIHQETIDGVIMALDMLSSDEYVFVSLDELIAYRGIEVLSNSSYRSFTAVDTTLNTQEDVE